MSWQTVRLSDICDLQNGYAFKSSDYIEESNVLNCRMSNIRPDGNFDIFYHPKFLPNNFADKYKEFLLSDDDVIIAMTDMAGEPKILGVPTIVKTHGKKILLNQRVGKLIFKQPVLINFNYLKYILSDKKVKQYYRKFANGGVQINLSKPDLLSIKIPLPPLAEQKRIAAILDKADEIRRKREQAITKLEQLAQSIFVEMFGDPVTNNKGWEIGKIADLLESATYGTSEKSNSVGKYAVLRMNNITKTGAINLTDLKYMDLDDNLTERYLVAAGDVLFNRTNSADLVGKSAIYRDNTPVAYAGYLIRLRVNKNADPEYLASYLNTKYTKKILRTMCKSIIGMANINAKEIQAMSIPLPPIALQEEFAKRINQIEKLKADNTKALANHNALFASLQQQAFSGNL